MEPFTWVFAAFMFAVTFIGGSSYCDKKGLDYDECVQLAKEYKQQNKSTNDKG